MVSEELIDIFLRTENEDGVSKSGQISLPPDLQLVKYSAAWALQLDEHQRPGQDQEPIGDALRTGRVELDRSAPATFCFVD
jgi:hypothetical protein